MRTLLLACILAVMPVYAVAEETNCSAFGAGNHLPELVDKRLTTGTRLLSNRGYAVLASSVSHGPLWAAEHLWSDDLEAAQSLKRTGRFYVDMRFPGSSDLLDYYNSIYDRGHMAPSGDQPSELAQAETYALRTLSLRPHPSTKVSGPE